MHTTSNVCTHTYKYYTYLAVILPPAPEYLTAVADILPVPAIHLASNNSLSGPYGTVIGPVHYIIQQTEYLIPQLELISVHH